MINILIVDDHLIVREGIKRIINDIPDMHIISEASNGNEAMELIFKNTFDIVLLDISMPKLNGLQTLKLIKKYNDKLPVLMLSMHSEKQYAMRSIKAGASGYMTKEVATQELVSAIRKINDGRKYISKEVAELLATDLYHEDEKEPHENLSDREFEILKMIARGLTSKVIAAELIISPKTVSTYRSRILEKLDLHNNSDIIHYVIDYNLTD
jgi:DNA-binding NarL/FixJ family response regulator